MSFLKRKPKRPESDPDLIRIEKDLQDTRARTITNMARVERIRRVVEMRGARNGG